jgi:hypothetical protein
MAALDEMSLAGGTGTSCLVARSTLAGDRLTSAIIRLGDWEIEVSEHSKFVVARGGASTDYVTTVGQALQHAQ